MKFLLIEPMTKTEFTNYNINLVIKELISRNIKYKIVDGYKPLNNLEKFDAVIPFTGVMLVVNANNLRAIKDKCFNKVDSCTIARDKWLTYKKIGNTIKQPLTSLKQTDIGFPCMVKGRYGSYGSQVFLARNQNELENVLTKFKDKNSIIYQQYIESENHSHIRVMCVGDQCLGAMIVKAAKGKVVSNAHQGGKALPYNPTQEMVDMALSAHNTLGLHYSGTDLIVDKNTGEVYFLEINSNAHTQTFDRVCGINTTKIRIDSICEIVERINDGKESGS